MRRVAVCLLPLVTAGCFSLDRHNGVERGEVTGTAVGVDRAAVGGARIDLQSTTRALRANDDGAFVVAGLAGGRWTLKLAADDNDDGVDDRSAWRSVDTTSDGAAVAVFLGDVPLLGTSELTGTLVLGIDGPVVDNALVTVVRADSDLQRAERALATSSTSEVFGTEITTRSAADGTFALRAMAQGKNRVIVVANAGVLVGAEVDVDVVADNRNLGTIVLEPLSTETRSVQLQLVLDGVDADEALRVEIRRAADPTSVVDEFDVTDPAAVRVLTLPADIYDVVVFASDDIGGVVPRGFLGGVPSVLGDATDPVSWRVVVEAGNVCVGADRACGDNIFE